MLHYCCNTEHLSWHWADVERPQALFVAVQRQSDRTRESRVCAYQPEQSRGRHTDRQRGAARLFQVRNGRLVNRPNGHSSSSSSNSSARLTSTCITAAGATFLTRKPTQGATTGWTVSTRTCSNWNTLSGELYHHTSMRTVSCKMPREANSITSNNMFTRNTHTLGEITFF